MADQQKKFFSPNEWYCLCEALARKVVTSGFEPNFIVGLWRGGADPAIIIDENFRAAGFKSDTICIRTSRYTAPWQAEAEVKVHSLDYLRATFKRGQSILLVDDIFDSGKTLRAVLDALNNLATSEIRLATVFYKPMNSRVEIVPDYWQMEIDSAIWIVLPHEHEGLSSKEIATSKASWAPSELETRGHSKEKILVYPPPVYQAWLKQSNKGVTIADYQQSPQDPVYLFAVMIQKIMDTLSDGSDLYVRLLDRAHWAFNDLWFAAPELRHQKKAENDAMIVKELKALHTAGLINPMFHKYLKEELDVNL